VHAQASAAGSTGGAGGAGGEGGAMGGRSSWPIGGASAGVLVRSMG
jgi:hypothetical protein